MAYVKKIAMDQDVIETVTADLGVALMENVNLEETAMDLNVDLMTNVLDPYFAVKEPVKVIVARM
tara:strand:+ start:48 stop:242 length:195 start_codon:yes stop_codon:yes gene_type:complete